MSEPVAAEPVTDHLSLLDWRRQVAALYGRVRATLPGDPAGAHADWRATRDALFATHPQSPLPAAARASGPGLNVWAYDPAWAFEAHVDTHVEPERFDVPMSSGAAMAFVRFGRVELPFGRLDVFWLDAYGGGIFLPFRDATAGVTTYGGGRYLLDTAKDADLGSTESGALVLDFNFAYHPSCHYNPAWSCPLAPPGSRVAVAVTAGEASYER